MLTKIFQQNDIPKKYRSNFIHLYFDIAWFGVLSGSAINFLNVYATRLGASGAQIGLIAAMSAIVNLFLAIPAGHWIEKRHTGRAVFWASIVFRFGYLLWIPIPWLFDAQGQIWAFIVLTFLMAIPLTPFGVGFSALFAEAVPERYRAHVASLRNITFAIAFMTTSFFSGYILENVAFPSGYQIVFGIGALGAAMSSFHLYFVSPLKAEFPASPSAPQTDPITQTSSPRNIFAALRLDIWSTSFRNVLLGLFAFHFAQYIAVPILPQFNVHVLNLSDDHIGTGTALFYLTMLVGSFQFRNIAHRFGNKKMTGAGVAGMALYPFLLAFSHRLWQFYAISLIGGFIWALVNGAYANYMLEHIPPNDRPAHLAWYTIILNFAILTSSILGPLAADQISLAPALILIAFLRLLAGLGILRWG